MNKKTEAKCIGQMLTVGFHAANPPLIWRFDLERNHSFTLSMQGEEGDWELGVTSPKGDFYPVAHFAGREEAEEALLAVEKILTRRKKNIVDIIGKIVGIVALVIVILGTVLVWRSIEQSRQMVGMAPNAVAAAKTPGIAPLPAPVEQPPAATPREGVPQSAEDILQPPAQ